MTDQTTPFVNAEQLTVADLELVRQAAREHKATIESQAAGLVKSGHFAQAKELTDESESLTNAIIDVEGQFDVYPAHRNAIEKGLDSLRRRYIGIKGTAKNLPTFEDINERAEDKAARIKAVLSPLFKEQQELPLEGEGDTEPVHLSEDGAQEIQAAAETGK